MPNREPTDEELERIKNWGPLDPRGLIEFIKDIWWEPDWGFRLKGKRILRLELHTGGMSDNEAIIEALQSNWLFWSLYWRRSDCGGHYYFRVYPLK
jgi:hypothetical protein